MSPLPGEIWLADLGLAAKTRPVVIVSRSDPDAPRALVLYVPLTTQNRQSRYEVVIPKLSFLNHESVANVQGLGSLPSVRLERKLGRLPADLIAKIKRSLAFVLELDP
jgi:mRNA interferase MazF